MKAALECSRRMVIACCVALLILQTGCGADNQGRNAVSGTVTLDGQPVNNATIVFTPRGKGLAAAASIVDGRFELASQVGPTTGAFDVRINPTEGEMQGDEPDPAQIADAKRPRIPRKYQQNGTLEAVITGDPEQVLSYELRCKP